MVRLFLIAATLALLIIGVGFYYNAMKAPGFVGAGVRFVD
jgi:hypothetical protein